jgi:hypothetical protein
MTVRSRWQGSLSPGVRAEFASKASNVGVHASESRRSSRAGKHEQRAGDRVTGRRSKTCTRRPQGTTRGRAKKTCRVGRTGTMGVPVHTDGYHRESNGSSGSMDVRRCE